VFRDERQNMLQMDLARSVHRAILTTEMPADDRLSFGLQYVPLDVVGGDFYRVDRISDDEYSLFLADVAGHGTADALYIALMHSIAEECEDLLWNPTAFTAAVNQRIHDRIPQVGFITAVSVSFNAADGEVRYCSAGHPPAMLQTADDGQVREVEGTNMALGAEREVRFRDTALRLAPGDRLLFYTDGVTEIRTGDTELLGRQGLMEVLAELPPQASDHRLEPLYTALLARSITPSLEDDLTLLSCVRL